MPIAENIGLFSDGSSGGGGGGGVPELSLSYNGTGPETVQVLDGLDYDPSSGGFIFALLPASLTGIGFDTPAFTYVDSSSTIQGFVLFTPGQGPGENPELFAYDNAANIVGVYMPGLTLGPAGGVPPFNPGNTPNGIPAVQGMVLQGTNGTLGYLYQCIGSYDPSGPTDAVWVAYTSGAIIP
jgi:hypothetical protein